MSALACLRVVVQSGQSELSADMLSQLVAKFTTAFLDVRWSWPRKFSSISPYAFLLSDPRQKELDTAELGRLSAELHAHLFGVSEAEANEVTVLLFEGDEAAMADFAELGPERLAQAMSDPAAALTGGQLSRITSDGQRVRLPPGSRKSSESDTEADPAAEASEKAPRQPNREGLQGVYYSARELFIGDVATSTPGDLKIHFSLVDGDDHLPKDPAAYDIDCIIAGMRFLAESTATTPLFLPVSFSTLLRASHRSAYQEMLDILPRSERKRLAAAVYDVPRAPSFQALKQVREVLDDHFGAIDLRTHDPAFEIDQLNTEAVTSVTLVLPDAEPEQRIAVMRRFMGRLPVYKRRRIWPGLTNIRTEQEMEIATAGQIPFLTGPAISRLQETPLGGRPWPRTLLPAGAGLPTLRRAG